MTPRQRKFCQEYAGSGNATTAAERAGYSRKTAHSIGPENLRKPEIQEYLETLIGKPEESRIATAIERQELLSDMLMGRYEDTYLPEDGRIRKKPMRMQDRLRAGELLARMRGELLEKHQISGELDQRITMVERVIVDPARPAAWRD